MTVRFIHTADLHLDSPLQGLSAYAGAPVDLLRNATRRAFEGLVDTAIDEKVQFFVIAGDVYDGGWKDFNTGVFFAGQMGRLRTAGIHAIVLHGNHDAESEVTSAMKLRLPDNVHVFGSRKAETFRFPELRVAFHGQSFPDAKTEANLAIGYPAPVPGWLNVGVLHTAIEGHAGHARYAPCLLAELGAKGYAYWALGHVHEHATLGQRPTIVFAGNPQGRSVRETGERGALLVEADGDEVLSTTRIVTDVVRWEHLRVDVSDATTLGDVVTRASGALADASAKANGRLLAARFTLVGRTPVHGEIFADEAKVRQELIACAAAIGPERVWVEKLRVETTPPWSAEEIAARGDAVADLRAMLDAAGADAAFVADLGADLQELFHKLPPEVRASDDPVFRALRDQRVDELIAAVAPSLVARVSVS